MIKKILVLMLICNSAFANKWQCITNESNSTCSVYRLNIPHGWLVRSEVYGGYDITFYPDEGHIWQLS